ncbi:hypothetical protein TNCV_998931 [Trichonephila clavipes]|nr:hypothetical protein TNCV_998931 [Trichonephila clavipes]
MVVCKCIALLLHGVTLNSRRAASPLVKLVEREERWESPYHPRVFSFKIGVELGQNHTVWCSKLRLTAGVHLDLCRNEFRGSRSDTVRQMALATTNNNTIIFM